MALLAQLEARKERVYPAAVALLAALVLFPFVGGYGLWDPQEFPSADLAREVARTGDFASVYDTRPPLSTWVSAIGIDLFGISELGARLPHAFLAFLGVLATYFLGRRLRGPRAGLLAAVVLVTCPLYFFQARQLITDSGGITGAILLIYGLVGLAWPERGRPPWMLGLDGAAVLFGAVLAFLGFGLVVGVAVPALGVALASSAAAAARFTAAGDDGAGAPEAADAQRRRAWLVAGLAGAVGLIALVLWYDGSETKGYQSLIGGTFRPGEVPPAAATFDYLIEQLAFGLFPWGAIAPVAMVRLAMVSRGDRAAWGGLVVLAWALGAYAVGTLWVREMGDLRYPAVPAIALGVGFLLDDLLAARAGDESRFPSAAGGLPLIALFVACAGWQIARDVKHFPEELASVHLATNIRWPAVLDISKLVNQLGLLFALLLAVGVALRVRDETAGERGDERALRLAGRWALPAAIGWGWVVGAFLALIYTPVLSAHFSYKNVFDAYFDRARSGEPIGVLGIAGSGPDFYSRGKLTRLADVGQLGQLLAGSSRAFAVAPATDLCAIEQAAHTAGFSYVVPYAENSRYYLFSNQLGPGDKDRNPLRRMIFREPQTPQIPLAATYRAGPGQRGEIELVGMDMPAAVPHKKTFKMTLYYKVNEKPQANYQVFVHFDKGAGRFQGDHSPLGAQGCNTSFWQAGDYIVDRFEVVAGDNFKGKGNYAVFVGFFTGSNPNWKNMEVTSGNGDEKHRVKVGQLQVK